MAATTMTILAKIRKNVVSLPADTEEELVGWINEAQQEAETYSWKGLDYEKVIDTVAGTRILTAVPDDWQLPVGEPYYLTGDGKSVGMEWIPSRRDASRDYSADTATSARSSPKGLLELPGTANVNDLHIYPYPDAGNTTGDFSTAGEYEIHIPYHAIDTVLDDGSNQTNFFTADVNLALYLTDYASGQALLFNSDFDKANTYLLKAQGHKLRAKRLDKHSKFQNVKWTPRRDVYASRRQARAV